MYMYVHTHVQKNFNQIVSSVYFPKAVISQKKTLFVLNYTEVLLEVFPTNIEQPTSKTLAHRYLSIHNRKITIRSRELPNC